MYWDEVLEDESDKMGYDFFAGDQWRNEEIPIVGFTVKGKTTDDVELNIDGSMKSGPPPGYRQKQRYDFNMAAEMKAGAYTLVADPSEGYKI
jgi:hypothetical protein